MYSKNLRNDAFWAQKVSIVSTVQCGLATVGKWVQSARLWRLNFDIETWSIMVKTCEIVQEIWWKLKFWATLRGFPSRWEKPRKNWQKCPKWSGRSGVPDFKCNFGIFIFEIERWSEKVKRRKLSKEFDGINIFWKLWEDFWENQKNWKIPFWTKWPISQF